MMRGPKSWAVACRKPDSAIAVEAHSLRVVDSLWLKLPFIRGAHVLVQSLTIGIRALKISAGYALPGHDERGPKVPERTIGWSLGFALVVFCAFFIGAPAFLSKLGGRALGVSGDLQQNLAEGAIRIGFFVGYIMLISLIPDIRRVFQYHGAEHKTIYAYENDDPLRPDVVDNYSTLHVRCGTNFLFIVMFLTIIGHFVLDATLTRFGITQISIRVAARILMVPLLAGGSYEVIRAAGRKGDSAILRFVSLPGLALQKITTRPPTHDQIEVAIKAMEAVISQESKVV